VTVQREDRESIVKLLRLAGAAVTAGILVSLIALPGVGSAGIAARDAADGFQKMPAGFSLAPPPERTTVYSADGQVIAQFYYHNRQSVRLAQVAPVMRQAIVAIEDSRFYRHGPLDMKGSLRALLTNAQDGGVRQGGSTLTQQYVKNLLVENAKTEQAAEEAKAPTFGRKLRELRYAASVEKRLSKDQILEGYLNIAYFGSGAYGVQAASQYFFSKNAADLTLPEAALLAGITNSPYSYDPEINPKGATDRRNLVLARMAGLKMITKQEAQQAIASPVNLRIKKPKADCADSKAPFFCEYVKTEILGNPVFGRTPQDRERLLYRGGLTIRTTLDMRAQRAAQQALALRPKKSKAATEAMVEPGTGAIKAMAVSKRYGDDRANGQTTLNLAADYAHGGNSGYSAGSTFKIFTLAAALDKGVQVRTTLPAPNTTTVSGFTDCAGHRLAPWTLGNAEPSHRSSADLRTGTWDSINTFFAHLEQRVGVCDAVEMAQNFGMRTAMNRPLQQVASQVLGTNNIDITHLAAAYAGFAARGEYCTPVAITDVTEAKGDKIKVPGSKCSRALDPDVADEVTKILQGVLTKGTGRGKGIGRPAAAKTGTCEAHSCALFAGYTPDLAAAVWYGDPSAPFGNPNPGIFGANIGLIWQASMKEALRGTPPTPFHTPSEDFGEVGQTAVPDVTGMPVLLAVGRLQAAGFSVDISPRLVTSGERRGTVASTSPGAGSLADQSSPVTLFVSNGSESGGGHGNRGGGMPFPFN
jgi:membrane peptidoglycan carboxypeptidase